VTPPIEYSANSKPAVSVIISFLNAQRFLSEAIESVLGQTFGDWELLLVDDGSDDSSTAFARTLASKIPNKIRYLEHEHHRNRGLPASRNLGMRYARARYIALLDADDVWQPKKLEEQVRLLEACPEAAMVYGHSVYWWSWTGREEDRDRDRTPDLHVELDRVHYPPTLLRACLSGRAPTPCPSDLVFRRDAILPLGGFEETFTGMYGMYEDQAFLTKVFLNLPVLVANKCWDRYRQHADSICEIQRRSGCEKSIRLFYLRWLESYLSAQNVDDELVWKFVQRRLWPFRHRRLAWILGPPVRLARQMQGRYLDWWRGQPR
jgi:glycosyltransferase involved in cell wall biosynthesis